MKLNYRYDTGLEFLQYCSNNELSFFVELYKKEAKLMEDLTSQKEYENNYPNHSKYWKLIAAELQYFGGNTFSNLGRKKGVLYKDIISDICSKELISFDNNADVAQIEKVFIFEYLKKSIDTLNEKELLNFKSSLKITDCDEIKLINHIRERIFTNKEFFENSIKILLNSFGKSFGKLFLKNPIPFIGQQVIGKIVAMPISMAINIKDISDPATRITLPCVLYISYLRNKYNKQDLQFRHRYNPLVGSILRTELMGYIDHSGIYLGNNEVIEIVNKEDKGYVTIIDFNSFVQSSWLRTGVSVYIAIDRLSKDIIKDEKIANIARKHNGKINDYQLLNNNCHSFVHKCIINEEFDKITKIWKFIHLTESISKNMNNNRQVEWVVCDINPVEFKKKTKWKIEDEVV